MAQYEIIELEKISQHQEVMVAAYRASMPLMENGWMRYPAASWDKPVLAVLAGETCVGGLQSSEDLDARILRVDFAWVDHDHPSALVMLLTRFRQRYRATVCTEIRFTCHRGNGAMKKAVALFGLEPFAQSYRMPVARLAECRRIAAA